MSKYRVSADIGGTFTDIVVEPSDAPVFVGKVPTSTDDPARAVIDGVGSLIDDFGDIEFFVHGTTVGLNAFLERKGERVLLICSAGHADSYTIARGDRKVLYDVQYRKPEQLVPRRDVHEVRGRLRWDGTELESLNRSDFEPIIQKAKDENIQCIAICFLHSYAFPEHELQAREVLHSALPEVSVSLSHEVAREWREYERGSSVVMNAYVAPPVQRYLKSLQASFDEKGMEAPVHIMQSNGGVTAAENASKTPVFTLLSGPVGGTIASESVGRSVDRRNFLCVDMGGTSFDLSLVIDYQANTTLETELEGLPLLMSIIDIHTIGAGGGSIAWLENGALRVGPHSAGSTPGPVCYGNGGQDPTVTDANLFLGRLGASSLLGGQMQLAVEECNQAIGRLASKIGLEPQVLAEGILAISNSKMADAMRTITISEGIDPREFTLVAFGGAGPMAAAFLAHELDIGEVLIPKFPGTFSAWGMLETDVRQDFTSNFYQAFAQVETEELRKCYDDLEKKGLEAMKKEGIEQSDISYRRSADMRYMGQEFTINVEVHDIENMQKTANEFHSTHETRYGHSNKKAPVEFVNLRVAVFGKIKKFRTEIDVPEHQKENPQIGSRNVIFDGQAIESPILDRTKMALDGAWEGPLVIEEQSATTVVPPGWSVHLDRDANILLRSAGTE